ncbi:MAG TPA: RluA family pseudouridine synthase [Candidatus Paceibacterota bacterium]|nr:RluA family pseudouridine synthase [Candidatus Paceibacterota bacterium]
MNLTPEVIYQNDDFLIINKPSGLQVHPARVAESKKNRPLKKGVDRDRETLTEWLVKKYPEVKTVGDDPETRPGIVHRLDKETSGIMVIPRTQKEFEYLKDRFAKREVKKTYLALVFGILKNPKGIIDKPIGIKNGTLKRSVHALKNMKPAVTEYKEEKYFEKDGKEYSLVEASPKTGRTHQIRVHLASIGHPIVGDAMYGPKQQPRFAKRLMLHAKSLSFADGRGGVYEFEAPLPPEFVGF